MSERPMRLVVLGLSLSSSWGNGHATTFRALLKEFAARGHSILFLERDVPWYASNRDVADPDYCQLAFYSDLADLEGWRSDIASADAVIVGSYVPEGVAVGRLVQETARGITAFYDIDTPVTLAKLERGDHEYLSPEIIPGYDLYLSFTGGPTLQHLERHYKSPAARALYCSVDPVAYPVPARRFVVAGPQYPPDIDWPANVERIDHLAPRDHAQFYASSRFTLNVTRADMVAAGWSPSVRLFEAAACAVPVISDRWEGIDEIFTPGREIILADNADAVVEVLTRTSEASAAAIGRAARDRVMHGHRAADRAAELEAYLKEAAASSSPELAAAQ